MGTPAPRTVPIASALNEASRPSEIAEIFLQMAVNARLPAAINTLHLAREVFLEHGVAAEI